MRHHVDVIQHSNGGVCQHQGHCRDLEARQSVTPLWEVDKIQVPRSHSKVEGSGREPALDVIIVGGYFLVWSIQDMRCPNSWLCFTR